MTCLCKMDGFVPKVWDRTGLVASPFEVSLVAVQNQTFSLLGKYLIFFSIMGTYISTPIMGTNVSTLSNPNFYFTSSPVNEVVAIDPICGHFIQNAK